MNKDTWSGSEGSARAKAKVHSVVKPEAFRAAVRESGTEMEAMNAGSADGSSKRDTAARMPKSRRTD